MFITETTNGFLNIKHTKTGLYLHSRHDPYKEIKTKLAALGAQAGDFLVIFGAGAGYIIEEAFYINGITEFLVIEPAAAIQEIAETEGILQAIDSAQLSLISFNPDNYKNTFLENITLMKTGFPFKFYESASFNAINPQFLNTIKTDFNTAIKNTAAFISGLNNSGFFEKAQKDTAYMILKEILVSFDRSEAGL